MKVSYGPKLLNRIFPLRQRIDRLEATLLNHDPIEAPVRHYFVDGLFAREMIIPGSRPGGVVIVGAVHKANSLVVLSKGSLWLATEDGPELLQAPHTRVCKVGSKNSVTAFEDCVWTNFYANPDNEQDIAVLAERFTESSLDELLGGSNNKQLLLHEARKAAQMIADNEVRP